MKFKIGDVVDTTKGGYGNIDPTGVVSALCYDDDYRVTCKWFDAESNSIVQAALFFFADELSLAVPAESEQPAKPSAVQMIEAEIARLQGLITEPAALKIDKLVWDAKVTALNFALVAISREQA